MSKLIAADANGGKSSGFSLIIIKQDTVWIFLLIQNQIVSTDAKKLRSKSYSLFLAPMRLCVNNGRDFRRKPETAFVYMLATR